jgi:hypothetical protein
VFAAKLYVKVVLDEVETPVPGVERARKLPLSCSHLRDGSAQSEALAIPRIFALPIGGVHVDFILERAAGGFIRRTPQSCSVVLLKRRRGADLRVARVRRRPRGRSARRLRGSRRSHRFVVPTAERV